MHSFLTASLLLLKTCCSEAKRSLGCGQPLASDLTRGGTGKSNRLTFDTPDGGLRQYPLHIPENYDPGTPTGLIWSYAGRGESAENHERVTQFSEPQYYPNHIVVYPAKRDDGVAGQHTPVWQGDPDAHSNDVQFTLDLLDHIENAFCIEEDRVFAAGMSNGGGFVANILACDPVASKRFAAFAASSGAYYQNDARGGCDGPTVPITCNNDGAKVPLVVIAGGSDNVIRYDDGPRRGSCLPSNAHFVTSWAQRDGLSTYNISTEVDSIDGARHYSFGEDPTAGMVQSYFIPKLGHMWTQEENSHFDGTKVFIDFFARWNLGARLRATGLTASTSVANTPAPSSVSSWVPPLSTGGPASTALDDVPTSSLGLPETSSLSSEYPSSRSGESSVASSSSSPKSSASLLGHPSPTSPADPSSTSPTKSIPTASTESSSATSSSAAYPRHIISHNHVTLAAVLGMLYAMM